MGSKKNSKKPTAIDIFSGCGGMSQGLKSAGFTVIGAVEFDPLAASTYRLNHKRVRIWERDIRKVSTKTLMRDLDLAPGDLDLLTGCPPCQGFSSMRRLNGGRYVRDERNNLLFDFLRFVRALRPKVVMLENVPGLRDYWRWREFIAKLGTLGYKCDWRVLDAQNFGVPQRRRRLLLLAAKGNLVPFEPSNDKKVTVREIISGLPRPGRSGDELHDFPTRHSARVAQLIRRIPKDGGSRTALGNRSQLKCHQEFKGFKDVYGRMKWDAVSPTITGGCVNPSKGRFLHPDQNRAITLREAALLQTFPRSYRFSLKRGKHPAALMIGNSLPPEFARRHLQPVLSHLSILRRI